MMKAKFEALQKMFENEPDVSIVLKKENNMHVNFYYQTQFIFSYYMTTSTIHAKMIGYSDKNVPIERCISVCGHCIMKIRDDERMMRDQLDFHLKKARELQVKLKVKGEKSFRVIMSNTYYVSANDKDMARELFEKRLREGRLQFTSYNTLTLEEVEA